MNCRKKKNELLNNTNKTDSSNILLKHTLNDKTETKKIF